MTDASTGNGGEVTTDLDALAASYERPSGVRCSVCVFIEQQPDPAAWDALMAGRRSPRVVFELMRDRFGYQQRTHQPVYDHRAQGHRR